MEPRKLSVGFVFFNYGSNGGIASEHPDIRKWAVKAILAAKSDPRVEGVYTTDYTDTPVIMVRNAAVEWAREGGLDVLIMVDSDQSPDLYVGQPGAKPFFESSFDFLCQHYDKGPVAVVAPYCGPPSHPKYGGGENVYVFRWVNRDSNADDPQFKQEWVTREEASRLSGFQEVSSGPTGLCMIDMRCFDMLEPPYFYYEYNGDGPACPHCGQQKPGKRTEKSSTEDCVFFRDLSMNCLLERGYNCVFCNWDAWAGHWKPKCVGKPQTIKADQVALTLKEAVKRSERSGWTRTVVRRNETLPVHPADREGVKTVGNGRLSMMVSPDKAGDGRAWIDDPRWETEEIVLPQEKPEAFRDAHNTPVEDIAILKNIVRNQAMAACIDNRKLRIVELGSWVGHSAVAMAEAVSTHCDYEIHCVDHWNGGNALQRRVAKECDAFAEFMKNTESFKDADGDRAIIPHRSTTTDAASAWAHREDDKREIDVLFIDADHTYAGCLADIKNWMPFVRPGGRICGHDYSFLFPGVKQAVHEVFGWGVVTDGNVWCVEVADTRKAETNGVVHEHV